MNGTEWFLLVAFIFLATLPGRMRAKAKRDRWKRDGYVITYGQHKYILTNGRYVRLPGK